MAVPPRLAELLAGLSLATDLGIGAPLETSLRTCSIATWLGARHGMTGPALRGVYYAGLLRHLGCTAWSHEAAALVGDDRDLIQTFEAVDTRRRVQILKQAKNLARGSSLGRRAKALASVVTHPSAGAHLAAAQCSQAETLARDLGLDEEVCTALAQMYERHDGRGQPRGLRGNAISPAAQLVHVSQLIESLHRRHGRDLAVDELGRRRGSQFSPAVVDLAIGEAERLWPLLEQPSAWERVLDAEPVPRLPLAESTLAGTALAFARFADLKSPHRIGHSTSVAALAAAAAASAGWPGPEIERLRLAALFHDLGVVSVGNQIWDHPGPLGTAAWEQVRLHAYYTERILDRATSTAPLAAIAGGHHERIDGSGYHRGARGEAIARAARILAAADAFVAMGERRAHREPLDSEARLRAIGEDVAAGRLCRESVALVLAAAGHPPVRAGLPFKLTEREAEVLGLLARGLATKEIAVALGIAPRTVKHHIEHAYAKTGVSNRAAAALFAARHDLLAPEPHRPNGR